MYKQLEYLREAVTMTRNQTFRLDLPKTGQLSAMLLRISANCTSGATLADPAWRLSDFLGKIEVIGNGATIIKSYDFIDVLFTTWLHQGIVPPHFWRNYATNTQFTYALILFGRYAGDQEYGLNLDRWDSVELRITNTATATYYSTDLTLSILHTWIRESTGPFKAYIRSEEWRRWTTAQAGVDYELLPSEFPICTLGIHAVPHVTTGMYDTNAGHLAEDIDFSKNGGTKQIFKGGMDDLLVQNYLERGAEVLFGGQADVTALNGIPVSIARMFNWVAGASSKSGTVATVDATMESDDTDGSIQFEARQADHPIQFMVRGMGPYNYSWLIANLDLDPAQNLDPKVDGECRLNITTNNAAAAANGTIRLLLERVVTG
jgi:hypothetical protein